MLMTAKSMKELNFGKIMDVYTDSFKGRNEQEDFYLYLLDFFKGLDARYYIWEVDDEYFVVLRMEVYKDGFLLSGLHTKKRDRNRGFAKLLLKAVCDLYDMPVYSHVDKRNIPSMRTHLSCGFQKILDYAVFIDGSVSWNSCTLCYKQNPCRT